MVRLPHVFTQDGIKLFLNRKVLHLKMSNLWVILNEYLCCLGAGKSSLNLLFSWLKVFV